MKTIRVIMMSVCLVVCLGWSLRAMAAQYDPLVEKAQQRLAELGFDVGTPDGKIGSKTIEAIKKFQHDQGLTVTGKLDEETLQKLGLFDKQPTEEVTETQKTPVSPEGKEDLAQDEKKWNDTRFNAPETLKAYLSEFPNGKFVEEAKRFIE